MDRDAASVWTLKPYRESCRNGLTTKRDGNGLGLLITKRLCADYQGYDLRLESAAGKGTIVALIVCRACRGHKNRRSVKRKAAIALQCERERG